MKGRSWFSVVALVVLLGGVAHAADEPLVGTWKLGGRERQRQLSGPIVIAQDGAGLRLTGVLGSKGQVTLAGVREGSAWRFQPASAPSGGITSALPGSAPATETGPAFTLTLAPVGKVGKFGGEVKDAAGARVMTVELTRKKRALICYASGYGAQHDNAFKAYGVQVRTYLRALGNEVEFVEAPSWDAVLGALKAAADTSAPYARVVTIGHGGWDGPIFSGQVSPWYGTGRWSELVAAIRGGTTPGAKYFVSACHAGGSDRWERADGYRVGQVWTDEVAKATGRFVMGPAGITSTTAVVRQVRAMEGAGTVAQETRIADATGFRTVGGGGAIAWGKMTAWAAEPAAAAP